MKLRSFLGVQASLLGSFGTLATSFSLSGKCQPSSLPPEQLKLACVFKGPTSAFLKVSQEIPVLRKVRTSRRMGEPEVLGLGMGGAPKETEGEGGEASQDKGKLG